MYLENYNQSSETTMEAVTCTVMTNSLVFTLDLVFALYRYSAQ